MARRTGIRLRALPADLFERVEEAAFRWSILKEAGFGPEAEGPRGAEQANILDELETLDDTAGEYGTHRMWLISVQYKNLGVLGTATQPVQFDLQDPQL